MENMKEIQNRIKSVRDTMKITNAMYMISSTKLQKAKKSLQDAEPYFYKLQSTIQRVLRHFPDLENPYFDVRGHIEDEHRKIGYLVITGDKGLAGAYNQNVYKMAEELIQDKAKEKYKLFVVGQQGIHYFMKKGYPIEEHFHYTAQNPTMDRARTIGMTLFEKFHSHELDEIYIIYTRMVNSMQMEAEKLQLLPLYRTEFSGALSAQMQQYAQGIRPKPFPMYPSADVVLEMIVPNYLVGFIYGALVESYSSEQNSRVMAMDAATRSAKDLIRELSIKYNRARQASITQEITEIVGGARAQKGKGEK